MSHFPDGRYLFGQGANIEHVTLLNGTAEHGGLDYEVVASAVLTLSHSGDTLACTLIKRSAPGDRDGEFFLYAFRRVGGEFGLMASTFLGRAESGDARVLHDGIVSGETFKPDGSIHLEAALNCNHFELPV